MDYDRVYSIEEVEVLAKHRNELQKIVTEKTNNSKAFDLMKEKDKIEGKIDEILTEYMQKQCQSNEESYEIV